MAISAGTRFGAYEVAALIGVGGMGEVYRATDPVLKRSVALKVLSESFLGDANRLARLQREAEVLAALSHGNVAHIYGLERSEGTTALVMELVEGSTLAERIAQGPIPIEEALRIATQIADALEAAHERGIVHRDLKPANIKLRPDGTVKVLDFGVAKALRTTASGEAALTTPTMTEAGMLLGTAAYMSPEQARGRPVDRRTDIWAFGCVLYEMLTGRAAFLGEDVTSTLARVLQAEADLNALPPGVSAAVRRTLELCLEKDVRKRIADISDVKLALTGEFAIDTPTAAPTRPLWRRALPAAAALVVGAVAASAYFAGVRPPGPTSSATPVRLSRFVITPPPTAPLSSQGGIDIAISPDGGRIVYLAEKPGEDESAVYVRDLDALEARPVAGTEGIASGARNLFMSPDGKFVGYSDPGRGVVAVAIDGRSTIKLADPPTPVFVGGAWAADDTFVYSSGNRLFRVSARGGGTPEPLMPERTAVAGVAGPVPLPGGHAVLFHAFGDAGGDRVAVIDLDTGREKTLVEGGSNPAYVGSGHLLFARGDTLMAVSFDASELAVTGEPVAMVPAIRRVTPGAAQFAISANGTLVYLAARGKSEPGVASLVWVDRTGKVIGRAVSELLRNPREPRLSPDGKRLLVSTGPAEDADLWSYELNGRPPIPVVPRGDNFDAVWSPDGKQIALIAWGHGGIVMLPADGSARTPQPLREQPPGGFSLQGWSADGDLVITRSVTANILTLPVDPARDRREIVARDVSQEAAALSPNGRWLAYVSNRSGRSEVWVQAYPAGVPTRVSSDGGYQPLWSRDGTELFYRRGDALMAAAVEPGVEFSFSAPKQLFAGPYVQNERHTYDVAPDGRFLMILPESESQAADPGTIVVVQNFAEELTRRVRPSGK
jgi:serine/threonine-protein kinase